MPQERAVLTPISDSPASRVGSGLIHNASTCHVAAQELRTLPVLSKTAELHLDTPQLFLPDRIPAIESRELARIEAAMSPETSELDLVKERLATPVVRRRHVAPRASTVGARGTRFPLVAARYYSSLLGYCHGAAVFLLRARLQLLWSRCWPIKNGPFPIAAPRGTTAPDVMLEHGEVGIRSQDPQEPVAFTT